MLCFAVRDLKNAPERAIKGDVVGKNENREMGKRARKKSRSQISRSIILFILLAADFSAFPSLCRTRI